MNCFRLVYLSRFCDRRHKIYFIDCIWKVLCLQAICTIVHIGYATFSNLASNKIPCIKLYSDAISKHIHLYATSWAIRRRNTLNPLCRLINCKVVIIPIYKMKLLIVRFDFFPYGLSCKEIKWSSLNRRNLPCRNRLRTLNLRIAGCIDLKGLIEYKFYFMFF